MSDRGKEFMELLTTLCVAVEIKQIRTTPAHPQTNGLCEIQHKTLTRELHIRSTRDSTPQWTDLLPEIQFVMNVSVDVDILPGISPFQLVFGRRSRVSGKDITFPVKITPSYPVNKSHSGYVKDLCRRLQRLRLTTLDKPIGRKQVCRT